MSNVVSIPLRTAAVLQCSSCGARQDAACGCGVPYVPAKECVDWTVRSVEYAVERGASIVSIIPLRGGNGEMERLQSIGEFVPPTLAQLEETIERCSEFRDSVVTADLWDIERLPACDNCRNQRVERLARLNIAGGVQPSVICDQCAR